MGNGCRASSATWRRMSIPRPYSSSLSAISPGWCRCYTLEEARSWAIYNGNPEQE